MVACFLMVEKKKSKKQDLMIHKNYTKFTFQSPPESLLVHGHAHLSRSCHWLLPRCEDTVEHGGGIMAHKAYSIYPPAFTDEASQHLLLGKL